VISPSALSVIGFGSGSPLSQIVLSRVAQEHRLLGIVAPASARGRLDWLRRLLGRSPSPFRDIGVPILREEQVGPLRPDLLLVASYPRILPAALLASARLGGLNVHTAPLPRHRGPDPIFWTYMDNDAEAGVTVHWMDDGIDTGEIAAMHTLPLVRGRPSRDLYFELAETAAGLVSNVLAQIAQGVQPRLAQPGAGASYQSARQRMAAHIPFGEWPSERVWHVLHGLGDQFSGLVHDQAGARLPHGQAQSYRLTDEARPGRLDITAIGYDLHCGDGIVSVTRKEVAR